MILNSLATAGYI